MQPILGTLITEQTSGPCTHLRKRLPGVSAAVWLRPGLPAAHGEDRLRLLPSGPDLFHGTPSRGTWPSTPQLGVLTLRAEPSGGSSAPLERVSGYRAPLTPHLARSAFHSSPSQPDRARRERRGSGDRHSRLLGQVA